MRILDPVVLPPAALMQVLDAEIAGRGTIRNSVYGLSG
jgi:hypothetical protein